MSRLSDLMNQYFIEMVDNPVTKEAMHTRLKQPVHERAPGYPETYNATDAFYVVLGCRFQDNPLKSILLATAFFLGVGLTIANFFLNLL